MDIYSTRAQLAAIDLIPSQPAGGDSAAGTQLTMATVNTLGTAAVPTMATQPQIYVEPEPDTDVDSFEREANERIQRRHNRRRLLHVAIWMLVVGLVLMLFGWFMADRKNNMPSNDSTPVVVTNTPTPPPSPPPVTNIPVVVTNTPPPPPPPSPPPPPPVVETVALVGMNNEERFLQSLVASGESGRFFRISGNLEKAAGKIR